MFLIANIGQALVLYFGGRQIINGTLTLGQYQEFSLYLIFIFFPLAQLGFIITQMSQASASAGRIFEILDTKNEVADKPTAVPLPSVQGKVAFDNVTFRYFGGGDPVLSEVSFEAEPGQTVALLGATGSGKTTIINLIPRFYDPTEGRVTIDGLDIRDVTLETLRSQIGIVWNSSSSSGSKATPRPISERPMRRHPLTRNRSTRPSFSACRRCCGPAGKHSTRPCRRPQAKSCAKALAAAAASWTRSPGTWLWYPVVARSKERPRCDKRA